MKASEYKGPEKVQVDATYICRCAIDKMGYLIIIPSAGLVEQQESSAKIGIQWESSFAPAKK